MSNLQNIIFIHIPKTAGSSLYENFYHQYPLLKFMHYLDHQHGDLMGVNDQFRQEDFKSLPSWVKRRVQIHGGHMPFGFHNTLAEKSQYITFLREPVSRVISNYLHIKHHRHHPQNSLIVRENLSIKDYVMDDRFGGGRNLMTRMLAGTYSSARVNLSLYERAMENVNSVNMFVGFTEDFENSLALLSAKLNWRKPIIMAHANKGGLKPQSEIFDCYDWIREQNKCDVKLYEELKARYETDLKLIKVEQIKQRSVSFSKTIRFQTLMKKRMVRACNLWISNKQRGKTLLS